MTISNIVRRRPPAAVKWVIGATLLALNLWFDFYHSGGFILDGIILVSLSIWFLKSKNNSHRNSDVH